MIPIVILDSDLDHDLNLGLDRDLSDVWGIVLITDAFLVCFYSYGSIPQGRRAPQRVQHTRADRRRLGGESTNIDKCGRA